MDRRFSLPTEYSIDKVDIDGRDVRALLVKFTIFENIYIPGFGRTYDSTKIGTGFSYTLSYLLPIYKKGPKKKKNVEEAQSITN